MKARAKKQQERLAFQAAILAGDEAAKHAYADWLEDQGDAKEARAIRNRLAKEAAVRAGEKTADPWGFDTVRWHVECELIGKADGLLRSQTAFKDGWYDRLVAGAGGLLNPMSDGFKTCADKGYVPTLRRGKALQARLGAYLEALGVRVFWVE